MTDSAAGGASREAIKAHYDVSGDFYRLWLDDSMTYSCALWEASESLQQAQVRKLDLHIEQAHAAGAARVLDVGCGWGALLQRLAQRGVAEPVGITLSDAQASHIRALGIPGASVATESWRDHAPARPYDSIVSIGAMEHFVRPELPESDRIAVYRDFFASCSDWLLPGRWMSLQTIAYGSGRFKHGAIASIFPESDLPRLSEIVAALEDHFELVRLRNDRTDYARTCRVWLERLRGNRDSAVEIVGEQIVSHYEAFLGASARGFDAGVFVLHRLQLRRFGGSPGS